jgi:ABC-type nitrate/sulfonate/bicarbonate transport system substrate-binding protein
MIFRFAFFVALAFTFASCTSTDFQSWEGGNSVVQGHGGTRKVVDGMDVWTHGDPPGASKCWASSRMKGRAV